MEIPEKTIESAIRSITDYFDKFPSGHHIDKQFLVEKKICKPEELDRLINILCEKEIISCSPISSDNPAEIILKNHHYFEDKRKIKKLENKETRRFWIEIVKDIIIFVLGLIVEGKFGIFRSIIR